MLNVDRVAEQLLSLGHGGVQVRGLPDSAWLPMRKPHKSADCRDATSCPPMETAKRGYRWGRTTKAPRGAQSPKAQIPCDPPVFVQVLAQCSARDLHPGTSWRGVEVFLRAKDLPLAEE